MSIASQILLASTAATEAVNEPTFIGTLGLNWKLFLAQLINFGIIFFILWRWVFRPISSALEARRQKIEKSVKQAEDVEKRVSEFEIGHQKRLVKSAAEAEEITKKADAMAEESKRQVLAATHVEGERMLVEAKAIIDSEKKKMLQEVREELATLTIMASEKILRSKLDAESDQKIITLALDSLDSGKKDD